MNNYIKTGFQNDILECLPSCEKTIVKPSKRLYKIFKQWNKRIQERKQLAKVDERLLKDMGISRFEANQEIAKPFWRD